MRFNYLIFILMALYAATYFMPWAVLTLETLAELGVDVDLAAATETYSPQRFVAETVATTDATARVMALPFYFAGGLALIALIGFASRILSLIAAAIPLAIVWFGYASFKSELTRDGYDVPENAWGAAMALHTGYGELIGYGAYLFFIVVALLIPVALLYPKSIGR